MSLYSCVDCYLMSINRMQIWDCMSSHAISIVGEVSSYFITCSGGVHSVIICYNICLSVPSSTQACNTLTARNSTVVYMLTGGLYIAVIPWTALLCSCREKHEHNHQPMLHQVLYMHACTTPDFLYNYPLVPNHTYFLLLM